MHEINQNQPTRYTLNPFEHSVAFQASNLTSSTNQIIVFYIKCNTGLKWVKNLLLALETATQRCSVKCCEKLGIILR